MYILVHFGGIEELYGDYKAATLGDHSSEIHLLLIELLMVIGATSPWLAEKQGSYASWKKEMV